MASLLRPAISLFIFMTVLTGLLYPLVTTGIARALFPAQADGSLIERDGKAIGSVLIGQPFSDPGHFWSRPSATSPQPYNAGASSGSNLGSLNPALVTAVKSRIDALRAADPDNTQPVPADLVTASASGLDPDISVDAANYQVNRVAKSRHLSVNNVQQLVDAQIAPRKLGLFGEARINVLQLNLALDAASKP
ncbi:MAG TPA: potassium-transporting ATPase subunit KdpC [Pseudomonadales bacterium]|nr:potassium-transporting ATPase subunit KdpC [Pseudomonadales bacterium]